MREETVITAHGITVTIALSDGADGAPVVFVDTDESIEEGDRGPKIRVMVNDGVAYIGTPYEPREDVTWTSGTIKDGTINEDDAT